MSEGYKKKGSALDLEKLMAERRIEILPCPYDTEVYEAKYVGSSYDNKFAHYAIAPKKFSKHDIPYYAPYRVNRLDTKGVFLTVQEAVNACKDVVEKSESTFHHSHCDLDEIIKLCQEVNKSNG